MDVLLPKFLSLLEEEADYYRALLLVLKKENKAAAEMKLIELNEASKEKENIILKIRILEEQRLAMLERVSVSLGHQPKGLTLTKLSQLVEEPYSTQLKDCYSNLIILTQEIQEINSINKSLVMHSLELVKSSLSLLSNLAAPNPVYYRTGKMQGCDQGGKVFCSQI